MLLNSSAPSPAVAALVGIYCAAIEGAFCATEQEVFVRVEDERECSAQKLQ